MPITWHVHQLLWSLTALSKINLAKLKPQGSNSPCSACGIYFQKWKNAHREFIISVFTWSAEPAFTKTSGASDVAKNRVSPASSISLLQTLFGAGNLLKPVEDPMTCGCQGKSLRNITSASSEPIHGKEPVAGFEFVAFPLLNKKKKSAILLSRADAPHAYNSLYARGLGRNGLPKKAKSQGYRMPCQGKLFLP